MKPKNEKPFSFLEELDRAVSSLGKVVDERWWVEEIEPGKENWYDGWSTGYPDRVVSRSKYFKSFAEAEDFADKHTVDETRYIMKIRHQKCYEKLERRWL